MIRDGKPGDIVYVYMGYGPKARIIRKAKEFRFRPMPFDVIGVYYIVELLENTPSWPDREYTIRAKFLSRSKRLK